MPEQSNKNKRYDRGFGDMTLLGDKGEDFFSKPIDQQVMEIAWSEACPVPKKVVEKYGAETATLRYGEIIFADKLVLEEVNNHNHTLHNKLTKSVTRNPNEPVGVYEPESVPDSYSTEVPYPDTPWGFSLKRILVDQFGKRDKRTTEKIQRGLEILEDVASQDIESPLELLAILAEEVIKADGDKVQVMKNTLSQGHLGEQNFHSLYAELAEQINKHSPTFQAEYNSYTPEKRDKLGIAEVNIK